MIVTAWNNGMHNKSGAGYGLKIDASDRDEIFNPDWEFIVLNLENFPETIKVNINKPSFWGKNCRELIKKEIGIWLISNGLVPWPKGKPPKLSLDNISENKFQVKIMKGN